MKNETLELLALAAGANYDKERESYGQVTKGSKHGDITVTAQTCKEAEYIAITLYDIPFDLAKQICRAFRDYKEQTNAGAG